MGCNCSKCDMKGKKGCGMGSKGSMKEAKDRDDVRMMKAMRYSVKKK